MPDFYEAISSQVVACQASANASTVVPSNVRHARLISDRNFHYSSYGAASTNDARIVADEAEIVGVQPESVISVIRAAGETDGSVWVTWVRRV